METLHAKLHANGNAPAQAVTQDVIEDLTRTYARAREELSGRVSDLEAELARVKRGRIRGIRGSLARALDARGALAAAIERGKGLFVKPRTMTVDGIRVGFAKQKGKVEWDDEDQVVKLIDKHFPEQAETLTKMKRTPVKGALVNLTAAELKKIGCRITESGDVVVIKPQDSEVEKLVDKMLATVEDSEGSDGSD